MNSKTKNLVLCAMFAALTCAVAPVSIPLPGGVPISIQQVSVMLAGLLLGAKLGFVSQLVYLLLGAFGLPVFAGMTGGIGRIAGPSGGFLIGYPILAMICGILYTTLVRKTSGAVKYTLLAVTMLIGNAVLYFLGLSWFMHVTGNTLDQALILCMIPFIPGDLLKIAVCAVLTPQLDRALSTTRVQTAA